MDLAVALGGTITGEHGVGRLKKPWLAGQIGPEERLLAPVFYEPPSLPLSEIAERVRRHARGRTSWVVGSGEERSEPLLQRMYERGHTGPLWERLVGA